MLAICSFCSCLIVFICLSLWCWGLDEALIVSVSETLIYFIESIECISDQQIIWLDLRKYMLISLFLLEPATIIYKYISF